MRVRGGGGLDWGGKLGGRPARGGGGDNSGEGLVTPLHRKRSIHPFLTP